MKKTVRVLLAGRPNVGKSSLFNALLGYRRSIVLDLSGTTRDEVVEKVQWGDLKFSLVDCFGASLDKELLDLTQALKKADLCLFVVDGKAGLSPSDWDLFKIIKSHPMPTLLCINKMDNKDSQGIEVFSEIPVSDAVELSAVHRRGLTEIRAWLANEVKKIQGDVPEEPIKEIRNIKVALIGKPNVGKSTLMNRVCGEMISKVSPIPHTTRDHISFISETSRGTITWVDTAGIRRPRSQKEDVEIFSIQASTRQITESDMVFLLINASEKVSDQDMRLLSLIGRSGKPAVILLNFWDLMREKHRKEFWEDGEFTRIIERFPKIPLSAKRGFNVDRLIPMAWQMADSSEGRVATSKLNRIVEKLMMKNPPPVSGTGNFNVLYASQVKSAPPTFVLFVNRKQSLPKSYERYISESLRRELALKGQAMRLYFREARGRSLC